MRYEEERAEVVRYAREMERADLTSGTSGNVSRRAPEGMLITPSSLPYGEMAPEDILLMDLDGTVLEGERPPSIEHPMHLACYRVRADVGGVIHSHPRVASAFAAARVDLPAIIDEFAVTVGAAVRVADYAISGTPDLAQNLARALGEDSNAAFIASHGMVCVGRTLAAALTVSQLVERTALTYVLAKSLGGPADLPQDARALFAQVFQYFRTK